MPKEIEEQLEGVEKSLESIGEILKGVPTSGQFEDLESRLELLEEDFDKTTDGDFSKSFSETEVEDLVKSAVAEAIAPLQERIAELENSPVVKGIQDFDLAKAAGGNPATPETQEPEKTDVMKGVLFAEYPEVRSK